MESGINALDIARFTKKTNARASARLLSILGRKREYVDAINSDVGKLLFERIVPRLEELFEKVAEDEATPEEKMEMKVTRRLLQNWASEIHRYNEAKAKFKQA